MAEKINRCAGEPERRQIAALDLDLCGDFLLYEIPKNFQHLRKSDLILTADWRFKTRQVFQHYLIAGYIVTDLVLIDGLPHYLLSGKISQKEKPKGED